MQNSVVPEEIQGAVIPIRWGRAEGVPLGRRATSRAAHRISSERGTGSQNWGACPGDHGHLCVSLRFPRGEFQAES